MTAPRKGDRVRVQCHRAARLQCDCNFSGREGPVVSTNLSEIGVELDGRTYWFRRDELVIL